MPARTAADQYQSVRYYLERYYAAQEAYQRADAAHAAAHAAYVATGAVLVAYDGRASVVLPTQGALQAARGKLANATDFLQDEIINCPLVLRDLAALVGIRE